MYQAKNYENLIGINGISDESLKNHFSLYEGYVKNANAAFGILDELLEKKEAQTPKFAEVKRRLGWEFNGMRLHELYFDNLTKDFKELDKNSALYKKIKGDYDDFDYWLEDFKATALMRGIGWVILYYDTQHDCLINSWINEHDVGHLTGCAPLLVIDVFEHAYTLDYGIKKADYLENIFKLIDWQVVEERFEEAKI